MCDSEIEMSKKKRGEAGIIEDSTEKASNGNLDDFVKMEIQFLNRENALQVIFGCLFSILNGISVPLFLLFFGLALQKIPQNSNYSDEQYDEFIKNIYYLIGVTINSFISGWLSIALFEAVSENYVKKIKRECFKYLLYMDESWHSQNEESYISSKLISNIALIKEGYGIKFSQLISNVSQFIFGFIVGFSRGWKMALVMSASLPLVAMAGYFITVIHKSWGKNTEEAYSRSGAVAFEALRNIKLVKSYCLESCMFDKYYELISDVERIGKKASISVSLGMGLVSFIVFSSYSLGFWYGGILVSDSMDSGCTSFEDLNCFTVANVISIFFVITNASIALGQSTPSLGSLVRGSLAFNELKTLYKNPTVRSLKQPVKIADFKGDIKFNKVSFTYPNTTKVILKDFDLHIKKGKITSILGPSGCGKSSILKLILRLNDPDKGKICIDEIDLKRYDLSFLREKITMVDQESKLFNTTIRQNLLYGNPNVTESQIEEALKISQAWEFVNSFPNKLETHVGNEGSLLSGGQRQRIAIARAIIRNSSIIILDEATSGLDAKTEGSFVESFTKYVSKNKITVVMIAHRVQSIRHSDHIVILDTFSNNESNLGLKVMEQGSITQLFGMKDSIYSNLLNRLENGIENNNKENNNFIKKTVSDKTLRKLTTEFSKKSTTLSFRDSSIYNSLESLNKPFINQIETNDYSLMMKDIFNDNIKTFSVKLPKVSLFKLLLLMKKDIHYLILGIISASIQGAAFPLMGLLIGRFVTSAILPTSDLVRSETRTYSLYFLLLAALIFLMTFSQNSFLQISGEKLIKRLRAESFYSMLYQDVAFFENHNNSTLKLCEMLSEDTRLTKSIVGENIGLYTQNIVTVILGFVISFTGSVELTFCILGFFILLIPTGFAQSKILKGTASRDLNSNKNNNSEITDVRNERVPSINYLQEVMQMHSIIKIFNLENEFIARYRRSTRYEYFKGVIDAHLLGICWGLGQAIQNIAQAFGLWYGSKMTINEKLNLGDLVQTILSLVLTAASVCRSQIYGTDKKKARLSANKLFSVIDKVPKVNNKSFVNMEERCNTEFLKGERIKRKESILNKNYNKRFNRIKNFFEIKDFKNVSPENLKLFKEMSYESSLNDHKKRIKNGSISFLNITFSYYDDINKLILSNLTFIIKSGEFVALVGKSGCGKSTILELLERFYNLNDFSKLCSKNSYYSSLSKELYGDDDRNNNNSKNIGKCVKSKIMIDDMNIEELDVRELRMSFSYVQQNPILFSGTIEDNIRLGNLHSSMEEIEEASKMAQIMEFVNKFPEGLKTKVSIRHFFLHFL
ncbi:ATP-binding cassette protein 3 [Cryptosporidium ryanae]|uniref:ATP-binding cassette protein 3 n=1 Tax=Cryptosporidium ryanae TaxID=515981 RepID=UPI003519ED84|nr:ATP-binding cassette protein 3 [Cryptosporidium ryanae]